MAEIAGNNALSSAENPYKLINDRRNNQAKHTDISILDLFRPWINNLPKCKAKVKHSDGTKSTCTCTEFINNQVAVSAIGKYLLQWGEKDYLHRRQVIVSQVRHCKVLSHNNPSAPYMR